MARKPLVSFCIATYSRPQFIKSTLDIVLKQKSQDYEVVICEDPSEHNSQKVIKSFKSSKVRYLKNEIELGMTKSYNKAIKLAHGKFIIVLADDDPPTQNIIDVFKETLKKYPSEKAFFGASTVKIPTKKIEEVTHLKVGLHSLVNRNVKYGNTQVLKPKQFFYKFIKQEIFPHYQWTASIIAADLVKKIGYIPDYDSAHFIDYAYLLKVAHENNFVIINKELSVFELQPLSYGKKEGSLDEYKRGVIGFDKIASKFAIKYGYQKEYQKFLQDYVIMFLINRLEHFKSFKYRIDPNELFEVYADLGKSIKFLNKRKVELYVKLRLFYKYPKFLKQISNLRKSYGFLKTAISEGTATKRPER